MVTAKESFTTPFNAGEKVRAKTPQGEVYDAFSPNPINREFSWSDKRIDTLLEEASRRLGELNSFSKFVPDVNYFIQSHIVKEAEASSKIEGTQTTFEEYYLPEEDLSPKRADDRKEVENYTEALNFAIETINTPGQPPLSLRLMCEAHKILMSGVRGYNKYPGKIREIQNKLGGSVNTLADAGFIPPLPAQVPTLLNDLESFWHNDGLGIPKLIKIGLAHYQFETIHPFLDGNGRIGRLLIVLELMRSGLLDEPTLYLSAHFEKNRAHYYDSLMAVREANKIEDWLRFFLNGIAVTARKGRDTLESIVNLHNRYNELIEHSMSTRRQQTSKQLLKELFKKPVVKAKEVESMITVTKPTAQALVAKLNEIGILKEKTGMSKNRVYSLHEYIALLNN